MTRLRFLNGSALKIIALLAMTADHVGAMLFPSIIILRIIGRLAFPIFAYMIAEGCRYTKNKKKYLAMILGLGLVCQAVYFITEKSLYQCVLITFTLSVILIYIFDWAYERRNALCWAVFAISFILIAFVSIGVEYIFPGWGFSVDYSLFGVLSPFAVYLMSRLEWKGVSGDVKNIIGLVLLGICLIMTAVTAGWKIQLYSLISLILLFFYNGKRGRHPMKYLFYLYYPLHLVAIYGISLLLL